MKAIPLIAFLALTGCGNAENEQQLADLKRQVEVLESRMTLLGEENWSNYAYMTPGNDGYSIIKSDLTPLTVALADIKPYANGSKVKLTFGNISAARIDGLSARIEWGTVNAQGLPDNENQKQREVTLKESLLPGAWSNSEFVLEGVPPADLGFVRVRNLTHRAISLKSNR